jgi:hypothetical protein
MLRAASAIRSSLFYTAKRPLDYAGIFHITDSEGSQSFFSGIQNSKIVRYHPDRGLSFYDSDVKPYFIFGGDATDRQHYDLTITQLLVDFKKQHPDKVFLLAGNREITKNRLKIELDPAYIRHRLLYSQSPRWLAQSTVPLDYVKADMAAKHYGDLNDPRVCLDYVKTLTIEQCQLIYLKWMLEKTMGCPHTFRYRREELQRLLQRQHISDEEVLHSFIQAAAPEGVTGQYLQQAQIGVIIPETRVLAVHGGLLAANIGRVPGMSASDKTITNAEQWIQKLNQWYQTQIKQWLTFKPAEVTIPACTELDEYALPFAHKPKSVMTADLLGQGRQFAEVPEAVSQYLAANKIQLVLTGHQPIGDHPAILRSKNILFINGDTGYAKSDPKNPDDTRGVTTHTLDILASPLTTQVDLKATLSDSSTVTTALTVTPDHIAGDPYIGRVTLDHQLVQCRLANGDYRLIQQQGYQVSYATLNKAAVEKIFDFQDQALKKATI